MKMERLNVQLPKDLKAKLDCLAGLHSKETLARWMRQVEEQRWDELVADLLANHYDPAYHRATLKNFAHLADALVLKPSKLDRAALERMLRWSLKRDAAEAEHQAGHIQVGGCTCGGGAGGCQSHSD